MIDSAHPHFAMVQKGFPAARGVVEFSHLTRSRDFAPTQFQARLQNCEKRLLASSCMIVCPSIRSYGTTRFPLD